MKKKKKKKKTTTIDVIEAHHIVFWDYQRSTPDWFPLLINVFGSGPISKPVAEGNKSNVQHSGPAEDWVDKQTVIGPQESGMAQSRATTRSGDAAASTAPLLGLPDAEHELGCHLLGPSGRPRREKRAQRAAKEELAHSAPSPETKRRSS